MSQIIKVQKLQEGGTAPTVNRGRRLSFKVNDQLIDMYEQDLNAEFESYKKGLGKFGKNTEDWNNDYNHLINKISEGQASGNHFSFKVGDTSANSISYDGEATNTERGLKNNGKGAQIGLLSGFTGERNQAARNAALLDFLGGSLARSKKEYDASEQRRFDDEQSKLKKEKEEADLKQKALTTDGIADSISRFNFNKNFLSTSLNDGGEADIESLIRTYHKDPKNQANLSRNYLQRLQELATTGKLDSEEARIAFNNGRSLDLKDVTEKLRSMNLQDPKINYQSAFDSIGLGNEYRSLNDKTAYEKLLFADDLAAKQQREALSGGDGSGSGPGSGDKKEDPTGNPDDGKTTPPPTANTGTPFNFEGTTWDNFRDVKGNWKGQEMTFGEWERQYLSAKTPYHDAKVYYNSLYGAEGPLQQVYQKYNETVANKDWYKLSDEKLWGKNYGGSVFGDLASNIWSGSDTNYNPYRGLGDTYEKAVKALGDVENFRDITDNFTSEQPRNHNYRVVQETLKDPQGKYTGGVPQTRTRVLGPNGVIKNAKIVEGRVPNTYSIVVPLPNGRTNTFTLGAFNESVQGKKKSPIQYASKYQFGGAVSSKNMANPSTSIGDLGDPNHTLTDVDSLEIGALLADITTLGATIFGPAGGAVAGAAGLASTAATATARAKRGEDWKMNALIDGALDVATVIPIAGSASKTAKIVRSVGKMAPRLKMLLGAAALYGGSANTLNSLNKIMDGDYSIENFSTLAKGLTGLVTGKRALTDNKLAFKSGDKSGNVKLNVKGEDVDFKLTAKQLESLDGKSLADQKKVIHGLLNKGESKVDIGDIEFSTKKGFGMKGFKPSTKVEKSLDIETAKGDKILRTEDEFGSNPIIRKLRERAVKRQVMLNPELNPTAVDGQGKYDTNAKTYPGMDRKIDKIPEGRRLAENAGPDAVNNVKPQASTQPFKTKEQFRNDFAESHKAANLNQGKAKSTNSMIDEAVEKAFIKAKGSKPAEKKITYSAAPTEYPSKKINQTTSWEEGAKYKATKAETTSKAVEKIAKDSFFNDKELKSIRKSLSLKRNNTSVITKEQLANPQSQKDKTIAKKLTELSQKDPKIKEWLGSADAEGKLYLKKGGVVKAQLGTRIKLKYPTVQAPTSAMMGTDKKFYDNLYGGLGTGFKPFSRDYTANNQGTIDATSPVVAAQPEIVKSGESTNPLYGRGAPVAQAPVTSGGFSLNRNDLSEWFRAFANRKAHGLLDTKSSVALATGPVETNFSVKGDMLAQSAYDRGANRLRQSADRNLTSDGGLGLAGRLATNAKATDLELQGAIQNAGAMRQQEGQQVQMAQQYAGVRAEVANRNAQALAAKEQAERVGRNTRYTSMFKSLDNAWARQNSLGYQKEARLQGINDQIHILNAQNEPIGGTSSFANKTGVQATTELSNKYDQLSRQYETTSDPAERARIEDELRVVKNQMNQVQNDIRLKGLNTMLGSPRQGDFNVNFGSLNFLKNRPNVTAAFKKGGSLSMSDRVQLEDIKQNHKRELQWYKNYSKFISDKANNDSRQAMASEKELSRLINKALGGK